MSKAIDDKVNDKDVLPIVRVVDTSRSGVDKGMGTVTRASSNSGNLPNLGLVSTKEVDSGVHRSAAPSSTMQQQFLKTGHGSMLQQHRPIRSEAITQQQEHPPVSGVSQQPRREAPPSQSLHVQQPLPQPLQNIHRISQDHLSQGPVQSQSVPLSSIPVTDIKGTPGSALNKIGASTTGRGTQATTVQTGRGAFVYGSGSLSNGMRSGKISVHLQFMTLYASWLNYLHILKSIECHVYDCSNLAMRFFKLFDIGQGQEFKLYNLLASHNLVLGFQYLYQDTQARPNLVFKILKLHGEYLVRTI